MDPSFENAFHIDVHAFIESITSTIEAKDFYTAGHSDRVSELVCFLCEEIEMSAKETQEIHIAAHLHDIGKVGIPDGILLKTGKLSDAEFEVMKSHPEIGYKILQKAGLNSISEMVRHHHERFDGTGYPNGLSGEKIPLGARIITICDSFDAMTTNRSYRNAVSPEAALLDIENCTGKQFDPELATAFIRAAEDHSVEFSNIILTGRNRI